MILLLLTLLTAPGRAADYTNVEQVLATFSAEPTIAAVHAMTMEYSKTDNRYVEAWLRAAKNAAWLPELVAQYGYSDSLDNGFTYQTGTYEWDADEPLADDIGVGIDQDVDVRVKWQLSKLVMSSDRIRVISETQDIVKLRDKVLEQVTRVYFERRRLQVEMLLNSGDLKAQLKNELRLQELTAQIDAITGGRFSEALVKK